MRSTTFALEARSYLYDAASRPTASSSTGGFGSREQQLGAILTAGFRQFYLNTSGYLGNVTRTATMVPQVATSERIPRNYLTAAVGWTGVPGW